MTRSWRLSAFSILLLAFLFVPFRAAGPRQKLKETAEAKPETKEKGDVILIRGGTLYTMTRGVIHQGSVLVQNGKIQKVGRYLSPPENALVLNAENKWVMPGFVVAQAYPLGVGSPLRDDRNPKLLNYLDPFSLELRLCLASGITAYSASFIVGTGPARKNYSFVNAVLKPAYGRLEDMLVKTPGYLFIDIARLKPSEKNELRDFLLQARDHIKMENEYKSSKELKEGKPPVASPQIADYVAVLKGELPVRFAADLKKDILKALSFVDEFNVRGQIIGAAEGWLLPEEIGRRNVSTILQPEAFFEPDPYLNPPNGSNIKNAVIQKQNGIKFAVLNMFPYIGTGGGLGDDLLTFPLAGAYAIRGGLEEMDALKSITLWPAELLGIDHRVGSIEEGKDADIIILDGNPFDYRTYVDYTILNGKVLYDKSKSSFFRHIPKSKKIY